MRLFNSFQLTLFFTLAPFGLSWLYKQTFEWHNTAFIVSCLLYIVAFCFMTGAVYIGLKEAEKGI